MSTPAISSLKGLLKLLAVGGKYIYILPLLYHAAFSLKEDAVSDLELRSLNIAAHMAAAGHLQPVLNLYVSNNLSRDNCGISLDICLDHCTCSHIEESGGIDKPLERATDTQGLRNMRLL